jgi:hypothetical protein
MMGKALLASLLFFTLTGCADPYTVFHSRTGEPLMISRRAYTYNGCLEKAQEEAARLGVTFRTVQVKGSLFGRSLLWPLEPGYACEAAIGPPRPPAGVYYNVPPLAPQG